MSKEFKVGLFSISTIAMFYLGFNYLKGIEFFSRTNRYYVIYSEVGGLTISNPVTISGFNVGRVADIKLKQNDGNIVLVTLDIDRDIILGDSAIATLDASFLGDVSVVVRVGDISNPIKPGDTLLARIDQGLTEMLVQSAQPITDNLPVTIANLNDLLKDLTGTGDTLKMALSSFTTTSNTINNTLNENRSGITESISGFKELSVSLNKTVEELKPLLAKFNVLADSLNNLELAATVEKVNILLDQATVSAAALTSKDGTLGKLMYEDSLYNNLNKTMLDLDTLLNNINNNPKHFFGPLGQSRKKIEKDRAKQQEEQ